MPTGRLEAAKAGLRRLPVVYRLVHGAWYRLLYLAERWALGSRLHEALWRRRHVDRTMRCAPEHAHRASFAERLARWAPFDSLLEIGCGTGSDLVVPARQSPGVAFRGVDINAEAVATAIQALADAGVTTADLRVGRAHDLTWLADGSVDVVLADAVLMHFGPDLIGPVLAEMVRVARRGVILNEWHRFAGGPESLWHYAHWVHDHRARLAAVSGIRSVLVERLPAGLWGPGGWEQFGALVEAER